MDMLMSFPPGTWMFQFPGFASCGYEFTARYRLRGGFPHSEIPGSTFARNSSGLIAACYVLHRLSVPRHPPNALIALDFAQLSCAGNKAAARSPSINSDDPLPCFRHDVS